MAKLSFFSSKNLEQKAFLLSKLAFWNMTFQQKCRIMVELTSGNSSFFICCAGQAFLSAVKKLAELERAPGFHGRMSATRTP